MEKYSIPTQQHYVRQARPTGGSLTSVMDTASNWGLGARNDQQMRATGGEIQQRLLSNSPHVGIDVPTTRQVLPEIINPLVPDIPPTVARAATGAGLLYEALAPRQLGDGTVEAYWQQIAPNWNPYAPTLEDVLRAPRASVPAQPIPQFMYPRF